MPALIIRVGSEAGRRLEVEGEHTIGREDQEFTIADPEISRRHALVRATASGLEIEDAGSSNGTFVNGRQIGGTTALSDGDEVRMGQTTFQVEAPRTQGTVISGAPPVDEGATVIRPSGEVPAPGDAAQGAPAQTPYEEPQYGPPPAQYGAPEQPPYQQAGPQQQWGTQEQPAYAPTGPPAKKRLPWLWIVIAVVAVAAVGAGLYFFVLGGDDTLDPAKVEDVIREDVTSTGLDVTDVNCPDEIPEEVGAEVTCQIELDAIAGIDAPTQVTYVQEEDANFSFVRFE